MKFGKQIQAQQNPPWSSFYVDYKGLKKIINSLAKGRPADAALLAAGQKPVPLQPNGNGSNGSNGNGNGHQAHDLIPTTADESSNNLQVHKAAFFFKLERELEKINAFYLQKENELKVRLRTLIDKRKVIQANAARGNSRDSASFVALLEGFRHFEKDLSKLQQFIELNATGFRKILKKWDKRSKSKTKELYLSRQVEVQPCFNREVIAELADTATANIFQLESFLADSDRSGAAATVTDPAADGIASDRRREFVSDAAADTGEGMEELEGSLTKSVGEGDREAVLELLKGVPNLDRQDVKAHVSRILWRVVLHHTSRSSTSDQDLVVPVDRLDFEFMDDINGRSCLHESAGEGHLRLFQLCIERGVDLKQGDVYGRQALHYAAMNGHDTIVSELLRLGADPHILDLDGYSPIIYAVTNGHGSCVRTFISNSIDFEPRDPASDMVPLSLACQFGHEEIALLLIERGAKIIPDAQGFYPQHLAAREGHAGVLRLLVQAGADVNVPDKYSQWTPLFHAASEGHSDCVRVLIEAKCDVQARDEFKKTPIHYAAWQGHIDCINLLLQAGSAKGHRQGGAGAGSGMGTETAPGSTGTKSTGSDAMDPFDLEADLIPSLSLPPPILPFRIYGHSYLDKRALVQVSLGHPNTSRVPVSPVRLYGQTQLSSLKLVMTSKPDTMAIPQSVILPLTDEREVFSFQIESFDPFSLEFDLYPTFGSKVIGKAVALPSTFSDLQNQGSYVIPLLDSHLKVIGEIAFELTVVKPFEGVQLEIGGRVETYWKSTNTIAPGTHGGEMLPVSASGSPSTVAAGVSSSTSQPTTAVGTSVVTASSLIGEHVRIVVQVTSDGVPVAYPSWNLPVEGFDVHVSDVTSKQFGDLARKLGREMDVGIVRDQSSPGEWHNAIKEAIVPLRNLLRAIPSSLGVDLEIRYPTRSDVRRLGLHSIPEINDFVDSILTTVYDTTKTGDDNLPNSKKNRHRRIVFSSFNPVICTALNWKQPNYAVFFASYCGLSRSSPEGQLLPANRVEDDRRCTSIREAVKFAKTNNLLGLLLDASILVQVTSLIQSTKSCGLLVTTFGTESRQALSQGVDATMIDGVLSYASQTFINAVQP